MVKRLLSFHTLLLAIVFFVALLPRFYKITSPVADWHSFRQVDTASVARNFIKFGFDPLRPTYHDLSNIQSGLSNPEGYRMVEFPVYQLTAAYLYQYSNIFTIEIWLRLVNIFVSGLSAVLIVSIVAYFHNKLTAFFAGIVFAILPFNIFYGRSILPDPMMVFWSLLSLWLLLRARNQELKINNYLWFLLSAASGALALLTKPVAIFLILPNFYLIAKRFRFNKKYLLKNAIYILIVFFPLWWWRAWIQQFPEGIPAFSWLLNSNNIRFKGAWFYWIFAKRIGELILGFWGLIPLVLGLIGLPSKKDEWYIRFLLIGTLLYFTVVASGNVQHDYYQILIIPVISVFVARGFVCLYTDKKISKVQSALTIMVVSGFMLAFSWYTIRTFYWVNRTDLIEAGQKADAILPQNAKVIAPNNGDTTFLYFINRPGWPIGFAIDEKIGFGATHYVTVSPGDDDLETKELAEKYKVIVRNEKYAIIDLTGNINNEAL